MGSGRAGSEFSKFSVASLGIPALATLAGGALAVYGVRTGKIPRTEPISRRAALVGSAAAFLPIVLIGVGLVVRSELHRVLVAVVAGAVLLLCTAGLTLALGRGAFPKTAPAGRTGLTGPPQRQALVPASPRRNHSGICSSARGNHFCSVAKSSAGGASSNFGASSRL